MRERARFDTVEKDHVATGRREPGGGLGQREGCVQKPVHRGSRPQGFAILGPGQPIRLAVAGCGVSAQGGEGTHAAVTGAQCAAEGRGSQGCHLRMQRLGRSETSGCCASASFRWTDRATAQRGTVLGHWRALRPRAARLCPEDQVRSRSEPRSGSGTWQGWGSGCPHVPDRKGLCKPDLHPSSRPVH